MKPDVSMSASWKLERRLCAKAFGQALLVAAAGFSRVCRSKSAGAGIHIVPRDAGIAARPNDAAVRVPDSSDPVIQLCKKISKIQTSRTMASRASS